MKKLIALIKAKEQDEKTSTPAKKQTGKERNAPPANTQQSDETRDLYWDGYSDIGYC